MAVFSFQAQGFWKLERLAKVELENSCTNIFKKVAV
jgi:hypothetical protein